MRLMKLTRLDGHPRWIVAAQVETFCERPDPGSGTEITMDGRVFFVQEAPETVADRFENATSDRVSDAAYNRAVEAYDQYIILSKQSLKED